MKLQILSDLHNEFYKGYPPEIPKTDADVLVLGGDISVGESALEWGWKQAIKLGIPVVQIAGNHEYYGHEYTSLYASYPNKVMYLSGVRFITATLWSEVQQKSTEKAISDYRRIKHGLAGRTITAKQTTAAYYDAVSFIEQHLNHKYDYGKTVVITHHGPSPQCHDVNRHGDADGISSAFWSNLEHLIKPELCSLWVYGHTHSNRRFEVNGVRVVTNQRGYPDEGVQGFDPSYVVEI